MESPDAPASWRTIGAVLAALVVPVVGGAAFLAFSRGCDGGTQDATRAPTPRGPTNGLSWPRETDARLREAFDACEPANSQNFEVLFVALSGGQINPWDFSVWMPELTATTSEFARQRAEANVVAQVKQWAAESRSRSYCMTVTVGLRYDFARKGFAVLRGPTGTRDGLGRVEEPSVGFPVVMAVLDESQRARELREFAERYRQPYNPQQRCAFFIEDSEDETLFPTFIPFDEQQGEALAAELGDDRGVRAATGFVLFDPTSVSKGRRVVGVSRDIGGVGRAVMLATQKNRVFFTSPLGR